MIQAFNFFPTQCCSSNGSSYDYQLVAKLSRGLPDIAEINRGRRPRLIFFGMGNPRLNVCNQFLIQVHALTKFLNQISM